MKRQLMIAALCGVLLHLCLFFLVYMRWMNNFVVYSTDNQYVLCQALRLVLTVVVGLLVHTALHKRKIITTLTPKHLKICFWSALTAAVPLFFYTTVYSIQDSLHALFSTGGSLLYGPPLRFFLYETLVRPWILWSLVVYVLCVIVPLNVRWQKAALKGVKTNT